MAYFWRAAVLGRQRVAIDTLPHALIPVIPSLAAEFCDLGSPGHNRPARVHMPLECCSPGVYRRYSEGEPATTRGPAGQAAVKAGQHRARRRSKKGNLVGTSGFK
jgi:hypothetical protein